MAPGNYNKTEQRKINVHSVLNIQVQRDNLWELCASRRADLKTPVVLKDFLGGDGSHWLQGLCDPGSPTAGGGEVVFTVSQRGAVVGPLGWQPACPRPQLCQFTCGVWASTLASRPQFLGCKMGRIGIQLTGLL